MATTTVWCTPTEVGRFDNRIHIKTLESFAGIKYFAVPTSDDALATQTLTLASSAMSSGDMLLITYDPEDNSGVAFGCQSNNCRKIQAIRLSTSRKAYFLQLDDVEGETRRALIYPSTRVPPSQASPAVLYFHGHGGDIYDLAQGSAGLCTFQSLWPEAVVVYAEGTPYVGAHGSAPDDPALGWQLRFPYKLALGQTKDLTYVRQLLAHLRAHHRINNNQVFAVGHSSGGFFTFSLMALMPHEFAKFAVLGAYSRFKVQLVSFDDAWANRAALISLSPNDHATLPRPVLYMFGKADTAFDNDGPSPTEPGWHATQMSRSRRTLNDLLRRNACAVPSGYYWQDSHREFTPTSEFGAKVVWRLYEGNHSWPSEASQWVIDFFQQS